MGRAVSAIAELLVPYNCRKNALALSRVADPGWGGVNGTPPRFLVTAVSVSCLKPGFCRLSTPKTSPHCRCQSISLFAESEANNKMTMNKNNH